MPAGGVFCAAYCRQPPGVVSVYRRQDAVAGRSGSRLPDEPTRSPWTTTHPVSAPSVYVSFSTAQIASGRFPVHSCPRCLLRSQPSCPIVTVAVDERPFTHLHRKLTHLSPPTECQEAAAFDAPTAS